MSSASPLDVVGTALNVYPDAPRIHLALSGGLDSCCLLHWLWRSAYRARVSVIHVHHGLQAEADAWATHCERACKALDLPLTVARLGLETVPGESVEALARTGRYAVLADGVGPGELMLTAHHREDQAETVLLQLFRGSGPRGLAAMPADAPLGRGRHLRPMLGIDRSELVAYAGATGIDWIEDPMNLDQRLGRAYLRRDVLPRLKQHWPGVIGALTRAARHASEAAELLDELARSDLRQVQRSGDGDWGLDIPGLSTLGPSRQRNLLRHWLRRSGLRVPSAVQLQRILDEVVGARPDRQPEVRWSGVRVCRHRGRLVIVPDAPPVDSGFESRLCVGDSVLLPDGGRVWLEPSPTGELGADALAGARLTVGYRRPGARLRLTQGAPSCTLKQVFQASAVPVWLRERTPILYREDKVVAVGDRWTDVRFRPGQGEARVAFRWQMVSPFDTLWARIQDDLFGAGRDL
jgi:tRNA(Ile)-lysidine synthase